MTNVSSLYNFRSCINGSCVNASSASRAVRNALKRYAAGTVKLSDITIEHKVSGEWKESESGMKLLNLNAQKITPATPKEKTAKTTKSSAPAEMTLGKALSHLSKVAGILKSREHLSDEEYSALQEAMHQVSGLMK
jgi:hypothetical protein